MADAGTPILLLPVTAVLLPTDIIPIARPSGTTAPGTDLGLTGAALLAGVAVNNLTTSATSNAVPPAIDAVNAGLALKANTADVAATIQAITTLDASQTAAIAAAQALLSTDGNLITAITATQTAQGTSIATNTQNIATNTAIIAPIQKAITVGSNVGNGSQAPVSVGGFRASVTGLESASVGGGAITITGADCGTVGGYQLTVSGSACAAVASGLSQVTGDLGFIAATYNAYNRAQRSAIIGGTSHTLPVGADYSAIIGGQGFAAPAVTETVYVPQLYLFKPGKGISFSSPTTGLVKLLSINDAGALVFDGTAVNSSASSGTTAPATATTAGVVKIGTGITVTPDGTISAGTSAASSSGPDPRKDLATFSGARTNTLVLEAKNSFSNPVLGPNCQSFSAQVIKAASSPATAVSAARTGTPAQVLTAINADIAALSATDAALVFVRFITTPVASGDEAHFLLTVTPS